MHKAHLTTEEAVEALAAYFAGQCTHNIVGSKRVSPFRLYEILNGEKHHAARTQFIDQVKLLDPELHQYLSQTTRWRRDRSGDDDGYGSIPQFV